MRKPKPTANPSMLYTIHQWWLKGLISDKERDRLRKEALAVNIYTGEKRNEVQISNTRLLKFGEN